MSVSNTCGLKNHTRIRKHLIKRKKPTLPKLPLIEYHDRNLHKDEKIIRR